MWLKIATWFITMISVVACTAAQDDSKTQLLNENQNDKMKIVFPVKDIPGGSLIDANQVVVDFAPSDRVPPNHINSLAEAIGKVSPRGMAMGTIICRDELALPTPPKPGEDWLLYYSEPELSKRVGTKISIKGFLTEWIIGGEHKDNECAILSSDQLTYVKIGLPCEFSKSKVAISEQRTASTQRANWMKNPGINSVVIARGVLRRFDPGSTKSNVCRAYFLLDQRTLTVTKTSWCN